MFPTHSEAQLMLTIPCDAGQSRSPNMVPFDMLDMVSYWCATGMGTRPNCPRPIPRPITSIPRPRCSSTRPRQD